MTRRSGGILDGQMGRIAVLKVGNQNCIHRRVGLAEQLTVGETKALVGFERLVHIEGARAVGIRRRINLLAGHATSENDGSHHRISKFLATLEGGVDGIQYRVQLRERRKIIYTPVVVDMELTAYVIASVIVVTVVEAGTLRSLQIIENLAHGGSRTAGITVLVVLQRICRTKQIVGTAL